MRVKFLMDYKGTEVNPADYKKDDLVELPEDMAWTLAQMGVVKFDAVADPVIAEAKRAAKKAK